MKRAKKSFGQHFLANETICQQIADHILALDDVDLIIEIGPGRGALTKYLHKTTKDFYAIEADRDMLFALHESIPELTENDVLLADFIKVDLDKIIRGRKTALVGNFPYNISTQIVFKVLENRQHVEHMIGMFQKEVSDRIISKHGKKSYGILSVLCAAFYDGKTIIDVDPSSFIPPPRVNSSVIHLSKKTSPPQITDFNVFKRVVKAAFGLRRKMLRNSLKSLGMKDFDISHDLFSKRPEQMDLKDFIHITEILQSHGLQ